MTASAFFKPGSWQLSASESDHSVTLTVNQSAPPYYALHVQIARQDMADLRDALVRISGEVNEMIDTPEAQL